MYPEVTTPQKAPGSCFSIQINSLVKEVKFKVQRFDCIIVLRMKTLPFISMSNISQGLSSPSKQAQTFTARGLCLLKQWDNSLRINPERILTVHRPTALFHFKSQSQLLTELGFLLVMLARSKEKELRHVHSQPYTAGFAPLYRATCVYSHTARFILCSESCGSPGMPRQRDKSSWKAANGQKFKRLFPQEGSAGLDTTCKAGHTGGELEGHRDPVMY